MSIRASHLIPASIRVFFEFSRLVGCPFLPCRQVLGRLFARDERESVVHVYLAREPMVVSP